MYQSFANHKHKLDNAIIRFLKPNLHNFYLRLIITHQKNKIIPQQYLKTFIYFEMYKVS